MSEGNSPNVSEEEVKIEGVEGDMEVSKDFDTEDSLKEEEKVEEAAEDKKTSKKQVEVVENEDEEPQLGLLERPVVIESGKREKRKVERLEISNDKKELHIPEGTGEKLGDCPRIEYQLNQVKAEDLKIIHRTLFDRPGSVAVIKKNIRKFNGFDFDKDDKRFEKKRAQLSKNTIAGLKKMCKILDLERGGSKEDILNKLMDFLLAPKSSGESVPKPKKKRKSGSVKAKSKGKKNNKKKSVSKKKKSSDSSDLSASESEDEEDDEEDDDDDSSEESEEESEEEKPKKKKKQKVEKKSSKKEKKAEKKKKQTRKKAEKKSTPKKRKISESSSDSSDDEPIIKKKKSPPSDDDIHEDVKKILEGANLEEVTMKTVIKQVYAKYPDFDLTPRKEFIKSTVKQIIS